MGVPFSGAGLVGQDGQARAENSLEEELEPLAAVRGREPSDAETELIPHRGSGRDLLPVSLQLLEDFQIRPRLDGFG